MKMKKITISRFMLTISVVMSAMLFSCSSDDEFTTDRIPEIEESEHTTVMHLTGNCPSYNGDVTRAASTDWDDGNIVYLRFYKADGKDIVCGKAVYSKSKSTWSLSYYGNLPDGNTYKCEAFYFTDATAIDNYNLSLTAISCAYVDLNGSYLIDQGELFVTANLKPRTARMRIKGTSGKQVEVRGVIYSKSFNLESNTFVTNSSAITTKFGDNGYTSYMYCSLQENNEITLSDIYYHYTKKFESSKFAAGESGYIVMPSQEENKGWDQVYYYPEDAVDMGCSVRWAKTNIGSGIEYYSGLYCSWGDAYGTNASTSSSYNNSVSVIAGNPEYDIATKTLSERWQIPSKEQWEELIANCTWTYAYDSQKGIYGYTVKAKNGNTIYLPLYFYYSGSMSTLPSSSSKGYYWTSTNSVNNSYYAYYLELSSSVQSTSSTYKYYRMQIRPILVK